MKTITELNDKVWYRVLKVIYILIFVPIFILAFFAGYWLTEPPGLELDTGKSYVICDNGEKFKVWEAEREADRLNIIVPQELAIKLHCRKDFRDELLKKYKNPIWTRFSVDDIKRFDEINYTLVPFYTGSNERDWSKAIGISFLCIVGAVFLFELIRRIFYYIVLGTLRPRK
jgi:hypothetical protein